MIEYFGRIECFEQSKLILDKDGINIELVYIRIADLPCNLRDLFMFSIGDDKLYWMILIEDPSDLVEIRVVGEFLNKEVVGLCIQNENSALTLLMVESEK